MLKEPVRIQAIPTVKLMVYFLLAGLMLWVSLVLVMVNLWNLKSSFVFRYGLPTFQINEQYQNLASALHFLYLGFSLIVFAFGVWAIWQARNNESNFALERKYAINFVGLVLQAIVIVNFFSLVDTVTWFLTGLFVVHAGIFLVSISKEKIKRILPLLPKK